MHIYSEFEREIKSVAEKNNVPYRRLKRILNDIFSYITTTAEENGTVYVPSIGRFINDPEQGLFVKPKGVKG